MKEKTDIGDSIINYFLGGGDEIKDRLLIDWLDENEANRAIFNQYKKIWNESEYYMEISTFDPGVAWEKINRINQKRERLHKRWQRFYYTVSGAAASILIILALSFLGTFEDASEISVSMKADYGSRSDIVLPDGSVVKLNSGSDITYSYNRKKKIREVSFEGEGFFDVAKDDIPFIIRTKNGPELKVLGTTFNLQAYSQDQTIRTSLVEGSVELIYEEDKLVMKPGDMVLFEKEINKLKRVDGMVSHTYGWLDNKLYMDDMSLADVCKYLERWYNVTITIESGLGERVHYNGVLQEETVLDAMNSLAHSSEIKYHVKGKNISITSKYIRITSK